MPHLIEPDVPVQPTTGPRTGRRLLGLLVALFLTITSLSASPPAQASTTVDQFVAANMGRELSNIQGTYPGQCVSLVSQYLYQVYGVSTGAWGNAVDYRAGGTGGQHMAANGFTWHTDSSFQNGDILVWGQGAYTGPDGHIAVWYNGKIFDQNYAGRMTAGLDSYFPYGFLGYWRKPVGPPADGTFVSYQGNVYRIAGGAPIYVSTWNHMGGPQSTEALSDAQWAALRQVPADGTYIVGEAPGDPLNGSVYRIAGGAPIYVSDWNHMGGGQPVVGVDLTAVGMAGRGAPWNHLNDTPADGTYVFGSGAGSPSSGTVFRFAGGAPIAVSTWAHMGGPGNQPVTGVDAVAIDNAGLGAPWNHVRATPADGTFIVGAGSGTGSSGTVFRVAGGAPIAVSNWSNVGGTGGQTVTPVDGTAVDDAGHGGLWNHLLARPANGTNLLAGGRHYVAWSGAAYRADGGGGTVIDPAAVAHAGGTGVWSHLAAIPAIGLSVPATATPGSTTSRIRVSWSPGRAPLRATVKYTVQRRAVTVGSTGRRLYSTPVNWLTNTTATSGIFSAANGTETQFRVQAVDALGNRTAWSGWKTSTMPVDDRSTVLKFSTGWSRASSASYFDGTYATTAKGGAYTQMTVWASRVSIIGVRSSSAGSFAIYIDGVKKVTVNGYATSTSLRQTLSTLNLAYGKHTIKLVNLATTGHPRLYLDAAVITR